MLLWLKSNDRNGIDSLESGGHMDMLYAKLLSGKTDDISNMVHCIRLQMIKCKASILAIPYLNNN